jgi:2-hydroxy-3-oxopropionate reductase
MFSIDPTESRAIAAELAKKVWKCGLPVPVEPKAIDGTLSVMCGGKKEVWDTYYDLLMTMAARLSM